MRNVTPRLRGDINKLHTAYLQYSTRGNILRQRAKHTDEENYHLSSTRLLQMVLLHLLWEGVKSTHEEVYATIPEASRRILQNLRTNRNEIERGVERADGLAPLVDLPPEPPVLDVLPLPTPEPQAGPSRPSRIPPPARPSNPTTRPPTTPPPSPLPTEDNPWGRNMLLDTPPPASTPLPVVPTPPTEPLAQGHGTSQAPPTTPPPVRKIRRVHLILSPTTARPEKRRRKESSKGKGKQRESDDAMEDVQQADDVLSLAVIRLDDASSMKRYLGKRNPGRVESDTMMLVTLARWVLELAKDIMLEANAFSLPSFRAQSWTKFESMVNVTWRIMEIDGTFYKQVEDPGVQEEMLDILLVTRTLMGAVGVSGVVDSFKAQGGSKEVPRKLNGCRVAVESLHKLVDAIFGEYGDWCMFYTNWILGDDASRVLGSRWTCADRDLQRIINTWEKLAEGPLYGMSEEDVDGLGGELLGWMEDIDYEYCWHPRNPPVWQAATKSYDFPILHIWDKDFLVCRKAEKHVEWAKGKRDRVSYIGGGVLRKVDPEFKKKMVELHGYYQQYSKEAREILRTKKTMRERRPHFRLFSATRLLYMAVRHQLYKGAVEDADPVVKMERIPMQIMLNARLYPDNIEYDVPRAHGTLPREYSASESPNMSSPEPEEDVLMEEAPAVEPEALSGVVMSEEPVDMFENLLMGMINVVMDAAKEMMGSEVGGSFLALHVQHPRWDLYSTIIRIMGKLTEWDYGFFARPMSGSNEIRLLDTCMVASYLVSMFNESDMRETLAGDYSKCDVIGESRHLVAPFLKIAHKLKAEYDPYGIWTPFYINWMLGKGTEKERLRGIKELVGKLDGVSGPPIQLEASMTTNSQAGTYRLLQRFIHDLEAWKEMGLGPKSSTVDLEYIDKAMVWAAEEQNKQFV
ncbi:hypothetical protein FRB99_006333 [Tulasnella sp. 403]|nr:hypothetical protein FRB99_006333 [Tulasnella sp. 403]